MSSTMKHAVGMLFAAILGVSATVAQGQNAERRGLGTAPTPQLRTLAATTAAALPASINQRRSLFVTDFDILSRFAFGDVMNAIAKDGSGQTKDQIFKQWWETQKQVSSPLAAVPGDCRVESKDLNGFPYECPRFEHSQSTQSPFDGAGSDDYIAIALSNRFDLASLPATGGTDCGEYRIVFARKSGQASVTNRNLIIFEAVLPNPKPNGENLEGCRPVAKFWADLGGIDSKSDRADKLHDFYFKGLNADFPPILRAASYGSATKSAPGQVRTNQFMRDGSGGSPNWLLREFHIRKAADGKLAFAPVNVKNSPFGGLFNEGTTQAKGTCLRCDFINVVASLAIADIDRFNMGSLHPRFNAAESEVDAASDDYAKQVTATAKFRGAIDQELKDLQATTLTANNILDRATALSCAGCHHLTAVGAAKKNLGGGLLWSGSLGFVHQSELERDFEVCPGDAETEKKCFGISPALKEMFLPHRADILGAFLAKEPTS